MKWRLIDTHVVLAIHDQQLAEHGGAPGVRDIGLLESALARPQHLGSYGDRSDVAALAAAYGYGWFAIIHSWIRTSGTGSGKF